MREIIFLVVAAAIPLLMRKSLLDFLYESKLIRLNYKGYEVYSGGGLFIIITYILTTLFFVLIFPETQTILIVYTTIIIGFGLLGFLDDYWPGKQSKGFKGHFKEFLFYKRTTAGFLKAILGFSISFVSIGYILEGITEIFLAATIISLAANTYNLFDLRPLRSIKLFYLFSFSLFFLSANSEQFLYLFPVMIAILVYIPYEASESVMLGDTGANILGAIIGLQLVLLFPAYLFVIFLLIFAFNIFCEKYSLTTLIERITGRFHLMIENLRRVVLNIGEGKK